jgi:hypothetical protein
MSESIHQRLNLNALSFLATELKIARFDGRASIKRLVRWVEDSIHSDLVNYRLLVDKAQSLILLQILNLSQKGTLFRNFSTKLCDSLEHSLYLNQFQPDTGEQGRFTRSMDLSSLSRSYHCFELAQRQLSLIDRSSCDVEMVDLLDFEYADISFEKGDIAKSRAYLESIILRNNVVGPKSVESKLIATFKLATSNQTLIEINSNQFELASICQSAKLYKSWLNYAHFSFNSGYKIIQDLSTETSDTDLKKKYYAGLADDLNQKGFFKVCTNSQSRIFDFCFLIQILEYF